MNLLFPDVDSLRLVITSQLLPPEVLGTAAAAVWGEDGSVIVGAEGKLARGQSSELSKIGVVSRRTMPRRGRETVACWHQLLKLEQQGDTEDYGEQTPILFVLEESEQLPGLVGEMLRLGNDRQSFRHLTGSDRTQTLLRVQGPPYYTLLRALDRVDVERVGGPRLRAYWEQAGRVWVELGYRHPVANHISPPANQLLLVSADGPWQFLDEQPFRDIYELTIPRLPAAASELVEADCGERVDVPLRLSPGSHSDVPELWVVRNNAMRQLEQLVKNADDALLSRLSFCVVEPDGNSEPMVVLRARPSRQNPPVLVLDAIAYQSYAKLKNLFVPVSRRIHPPLRRDTIGQLLASDATVITWLHPADDGKFVPEMAPDRSFRPLGEWVSYVLDYEHEAMQTWVQSHQFDFASFICNEEKAPKVKPPASGERAKQKEKDQKTKRRTKKASPSTSPKTESEPRKSTSEFSLEIKSVPKERQELKQRLEAAERAFVDSEEPIDGPGRAEAWRNLGGLHGALGNRLDMTICFANALWGSPHPGAATTEAWLQYELLIAAEDEGPLGGSIDDLLKRVASKPLKASVVAAYLTNAAATGEADGVLQRLSEISQYLHRHENFLPIRAAWLAWYSLFQISSDSLALARARDRVLERLFNVGLAAETNLPSFLRARGDGQSERYRAMLEQVRSLRGTVGDWIVEAKAHAAVAQTRQYAQLTFAFGLARLGETAECVQLADAACEELNELDEIHQWLAAAYRFRIDEALRGEPTGALPDELVERLERMDRMNRFKVDRLRSLSRILEPHLRVDAFTKWHGSHSDALSEQLANLNSVTDATELRGKLVALIQEHAQNEVERLRILPKALELSPRLGEAFARELLDNAISWLGTCSEIVERALLLNKSLYIAAHFGHADAMQTLVDSFRDSLPDIVNEYFAMQKRQDSQDKVRIDTIENLFTDSFRDLRKMGMREEIGRLYGNLSKHVQDGQAKIAKQVTGQESRIKLEARTMRLQLCAASGWYYFGQEEEARQVADQVRGRLFENDLPPMEQRGLACAYANAVAQAGELEAIQRVSEMFARRGKKTRAMDGIGDNMTTASHFSVSQLDVIEGSMLALVNEDFSLSPEGRRWLDEDEFLVRKRIHEDVRREF